MSNYDIFIGETIGSAVLLLLGGGVCAAVTLKRSKAYQTGWVAIAFGWGFGVLSGAYVANGLSGAHLNPAVTVGIAIHTGQWSQVPVYLGGQLLGAMIGAALVWLSYLGQFKAHLTDPSIVGDQADGAAAGSRQPAGPVLGIFATVPEIRHPVQNLLTEIIGTAVLVLAILTQGLTKGLALSGTGILITALVVVGIGFSLGGPTGYAINPTRDLGPRIVHALLPLPNKGGSDWGYALIPIAGPLIGGALAGLLYNVAF